MSVETAIQATESGSCHICGEPAEVRSRWKVPDQKEPVACHFHLCEKCKLAHNCYTCRYSKTTYLRYQGQCDVNFHVLKLRCYIQDHPDPTIEEIKEFRDYVKQLGMTDSEYDGFNGMMSHHTWKFWQKLEEVIRRKQLEEIPDCRLYKTKEITDFWNATPCKRHRRADPTKREFADAQEYEPDQDDSLDYYPDYDY